MTTSGGIINTFFALVFAVLLVAVFWSLVSYFSEFGSDHGKREGKEMVFGSIWWLLLMMIIYALVNWVRAAVGV